MRIIKAFSRFLNEIIKSCYDLDWYRVVRNRPWTVSLAYLAKFCAMIAVLTGLVAAPSLFSAQQEFKNHVEKKIPAGTEFEISKGVFSTTADTPLNVGDNEFPVIIDTSIEGMDLPANTLRANGAVIGKNAMFVQRSRNEQRIYSLADMPEGKISKEDLVDGIAKYGPPVILALVLIIMVMYFFVLFTSSFVTAAVYCVLAFLLGKLAGINLSYRQWLAFGCTAMTLPTLVGMGMASLGIRIPFAYTFIFFAFAIAVIVDERSKVQPPPAPAEPKP